MKRVLLLFALIVLVSTIIYSDTVIFERGKLEPVYDVEGEIWVFNSLLNIWEPAPLGQFMQAKVSSSIPGYPDLYEYWNTTSLGWYQRNFDWVEDSDRQYYDQVEIIFRGSSYYGVFNWNARVDIWWVQAH